MKNQRSDTGERLPQAASEPVGLLPRLLTSRSFLIGAAITLAVLAMALISFL
ncbi:MAG: hypothetical protein KDJ64_08385 [Nitratireductor sp.]|nr:hypothetical protein [Nitratireductor sp.]